MIVGCSARRATRGYSACLINSVFAIRQSPPIAVVITREGVFLEPIFAILSSRCVAGETSHCQAHSELGAQNVELREVYRARNEREQRHAHCRISHIGSSRLKPLGECSALHLRGNQTTRSSTPVRRGRKRDGTTFLDLIVMLLWPLVSSAAAWASPSMRWLRKMRFQKSWRL